MKRWLQAGLAGVARVLVVVLLVALFAIGSQAAPGERTDIRVVITRSPQWLAYYVADDQGMWKKRGLNVTFTSFTGGAGRLLEAIIAGEFDIANSSIPSILQAAAGGQYVVFLGYGGYYGIVNGVNYGAHRLMVLNDSPIKTAADMKGTRVGILALGGIEEAIMRTVLRKVGVDPSSVRFVEVPWANQPALLKAGQIDVGYTLYPFVAGMLKEGFRSIGDPLVGEPPKGIPWILGPEGGPLFPVVASEQFVRSNPTAVTTFMAGVGEAIDWIAKNPEDALRISIQRTGQSDILQKDSPPILYVKWLENPPRLINRIGKLMIDAGLLPKIPAISRFLAVPWQGHAPFSAPRLVPWDASKLK